MSELTKFYTFAQMENAVVVSSLSSSSKDNNEREHVISPLEPNFTWEVANEAQAQPKLFIDLGSSQTCNAICLIHHEDNGIDYELEVAEDPTVSLLADVALEEHDGAAINTTSPEFIKTYHFTNGNATGRYWRLTIKGDVPINFYAPIDVKHSMIWLGTVHKFDRGGNFPLQDNESFLTHGQELSNGQVFSTGLNVNPIVTLTRTYRVNDTERTLLKKVISECNGSYRPFIFHEFVAVDRQVCHFLSDMIQETYLELGIYLITLQFQSIPVVQNNEYH